MSIIAKIKQFFGIGGVDVSLTVPGQVAKASRVIDGQVTLVAKSDQHVLSIELKLVEDFSTGRGEEEETREFELGVLTMNTPFDIKAGETRTVPFRLPFEILKSNADELKDKGGALGALGKVAAFANAEKSAYNVKCEVDVKDTGFDPSASKEIQLVLAMCGLVAVLGSDDAWGDARRGLVGLQHRGQQGAGLVALPVGGAPFVAARLGLVEDAIPLHAPAAASVAIGHTRYATSGDPRRIDQPFVGSFDGQPFALAHNGQVRLRMAGRALLERAGRSLDAATDSAWLVALLEAAEGDLASRLARLPEWVDGAYALVVATGDRLFGARDRHGIRPLFLGRFAASGALALSSEPVALAAPGTPDIVWDRAIAAGEIVSGGRARGWDRRWIAAGRDALCLLETVYFADGRTHLVEGADVERRRELLGEALASEQPIAADVVIGVPSSGSAAARGYARAAGLPREDGLTRRPSQLRSFLASDPTCRLRIARDKLIVAPAVVAGRRVVVVDDSIVRGTTSSAVAALLREAGAREIHLRLSSPPLRHPCFFGVDMPSRDDLAVPRHGASLAAALGYDSVAFLSIDATRAIAGGRACDACFTGRYPDVDTAESALQCTP